MGLDEPLDDKKFVFGSHQLHISNEDAEIWRTRQTLALFKPLLKLYSKETNIPPSYSHLFENLPQGLNLLSFEKWSNSSILLRIENKSKQNKILPDPSTLFRSKTFRKCQKVNLIGQELSKDDEDCDKQMTLAPLEIKSFLLSW